MLRRGPPAHVGADLGHHFEGGVRRDAIDLRQVDAAGEMVERGPDVEGGVGGRGLRVTRGGGSGSAGGAIGAVSVLDVRLNRTVARLDLHLTEVEELQILLEREEMLRPVVAGQRRDDLGLGRAAPAMSRCVRELHRVAFTGDNVAKDAEPRLAR